MYSKIAEVQPVFEKYFYSETGTPEKKNMNVPMCMMPKTYEVGKLFRNQSRYNYK